jgi:hypothetical protein
MKTAQRTLESRSRPMSPCSRHAASLNNPCPPLVPDHIQGLSPTPPATRQRRHSRAGWSPLLMKIKGSKK